MDFISATIPKLPDDSTLYLDAALQQMGLDLPLKPCLRLFEFFGDRRILDHSASPVVYSSMITIVFTQNLRRHIGLEKVTVTGSTVATALEALFEQHPRVRGYVLDDTGAVRTHMTILVDGEAIKDRKTLKDSVPENSELYVLQALSGG